MMTRHRIHQALRRLLIASAGHRYYPLVVGLIAFASTATFTFPFVAVLIPAVLIAPRRWLIRPWPMRPPCRSGLASPRKGAWIS